MIRHARNNWFIYFANDSSFWNSIFCLIVSMAIDYRFEKQFVNIIHVPYGGTSLINPCVYHDLTNSFFTQSLLFHALVSQKILVRNTCPFEINFNFKFFSNIHKCFVLDISDWKMGNNGWSLFIVLVLFNYNTLAYPNFNFYRSFYEKFAPHDEKVSTLISNDIDIQITLNFSIM